MYKKIIACALFFIISSAIGCDNNKALPFKIITAHPETKKNKVIAYGFSSPLTLFYNDQHGQGVICHTRGQSQINILQRVTVTKEQHDEFFPKLLNVNKHLYVKVREHSNLDCYYKITVVQKLCEQGMQHLHALSTTHV